MSPAQERAGTMIRERVEAECEAVAVEAEARIVAALDRFMRVNRCRRADVRPEVEEAVVEEVVTWAKGEVARIATWAVGRMRAVGLDAEDLLPERVARYRPDP